MDEHIEVLGSFGLDLTFHLFHLLFHLLQLFFQPRRLDIRSGLRGLNYLTGSRLLILIG